MVLVAATLFRYFRKHGWFDEQSRLQAGHAAT
jgi:hypothetical protein